MSQVFDRYTDTAGNYHWSDIETGHHIIRRDTVGAVETWRMWSHTYDNMLNEAASGTYEAYKTGDRTGDVGYSETINPPKMYGWICPVCGRGLSPLARSCPCTDKWEVTC